MKSRIPGVARGRAGAVLVVGCCVLIAVWLVISRTPGISSPHVQQHVPAKVSVELDQDEVRHGFNISQLLNLCYHGVNDRPNMITNSFSGAGPAMEQLYLSTCYPIEIMTNQGERSMGLCSDWAQYIYHARARISDQYSSETISAKLRNCPNSIYLHGEHPKEDFFIPGITNYWMPNAEQISHNQASLIPATHTFLAKTKFTAHALSMYLSRNNITKPRNFYAVMWLLRRRSRNMPTSFILMDTVAERAQQRSLTAGCFIQSGHK